ncbi:hypothetical protein AXE65_12715 [Ventosimonas gracilis]|uniref:Uncharacterized protein n=1 Tax=Ventosimonas gracilis TaxID=1680762 RepID=A0A139SVL4_9GAMM|nr:hypothetical protein [Ventosimonas gracilis]KXU38637.1 hypothetical protein AXE65_12715 [Ventosimonas gracilis]
MCYQKIVPVNEAAHYLRGVKQLIDQNPKALRKENLYATIRLVSQWLDNALARAENNRAAGVASASEVLDWLYQG